MLLGITVAICAALAVAVGMSQSLNKIHTQRSESGINDKEDLLDIDMEESQQLFMDVSAHACDLICSSLAIAHTSQGSCIHTAKLCSLLIFFRMLTSREWLNNRQAQVYLWPQ